LRARGRLPAIGLVLAFVAACSSTSVPPSTAPGTAGVPATGQNVTPGTGLGGGPGETLLPGQTPGSTTRPGASGSGAPSPGSSPGPGSGSPAPGAFTIAPWAPWPAKVPGASAVVVSHGSRSKPWIALTIDDGGSPTVCREEFDWLRQNHIPATFFPTSNNAKKDPDLWREIAAAGYPIGDHTLSHINLAKAADHSLVRQLIKSRQILEHMIGQPIMPVMRPPAGAYNGHVADFAGSVGYHTLLLWSDTDADTGLHSTPAGMIQRAERGSNGAILLSHCNRQMSADIIPTIVADYLARGFTFVTIPQMLKGSGLGG